VESGKKVSCCITRSASGEIPGKRILCSHSTVLRASWATFPSTKGAEGCRLTTHRVRADQPRQRCHSSLDRKAVVYARQSSPHQVINNQESLRLQYALRQRACELGWHEADIDVIDADLGLSGAAASHRQGFKELVARVTLGEVGLILSIEVTRLARNCSDWYPLLDVCGHRSCLIGDRDGVYDPGTPNGRLLLGLKFTISELELHTIRGRLTAGLPKRNAASWHSNFRPASSAILPVSSRRTQIVRCRNA
jgi:DNA invertase Pin-like site-specific DNA recombinase